MRHRPQYRVICFAAMQMVVPRLPLCPRLGSITVLVQLPRPAIILAMSPQTGTCSVCKEVKEGPVPTAPAGGQPLPFVCSDCLKKHKM